MFPLGEIKSIEIVLKNQFAVSQEEQGYKQNYGFVFMHFYYMLEISQAHLYNTNNQFLTQGLRAREKNGGSSGRDRGGGKRRKRVKFWDGELMGLFMMEELSSKILGW